MWHNQPPSPRFAQLSLVVGRVDLLRYHAFHPRHESSLVSRGQSVGELFLLAQLAIRAWHKNVRKRLTTVLRGGVFVFVAAAVVLARLQHLPGGGSESANCGVRYGDTVLLWLYLSALVSSDFGVAIRVNRYC